MLGQQGSCITIVELSENILQNLGNDLMTDSVVDLAVPKGAYERNLTKFEANVHSVISVAH